MIVLSLVIFVSVFFGAQHELNTKKQYTTFTTDSNKTPPTLDIQEKENNFNSNSYLTEKDIASSNFYTKMYIF